MSLMYSIVEYSNGLHKVIFFLQNMETDRGGGEGRGSGPENGLGENIIKTSFFTHKIPPPHQIGPMTGQKIMPYYRFLLDIRFYHRIPICYETKNVDKDSDPQVQVDIFVFTMYDMYNIHYTFGTHTKSV